MTLRARSAAWLLALAATVAAAAPARTPPQEAPTRPLRSLVHVEGVRENQLVGYGIVVGLNGSGDSTQVKAAGQSVSNLLKQFGVKLPERTESKSKNVATVMVSAVFPPGYRKGQQIDITVSSLGDAKSLRGGTLLLTPLRAADGEVYALAQGNVVVGGVSAAGASGSSVTINTPTSGRVPNGATVEREIETDFDAGGAVRLSLKRPNFETATAVVEAINRRWAGAATTRDGTTVEVAAPQDPTERVAFVAALGRLPIATGAEVPKVVFNSRTGTVVIAEGVRVRPAAVSHGALRVVISETPQVSQPTPFSRGGETAVVPRSDVQVDQQGGGRMFRWPASTSLQTIVDVINATGATPDDVMAILQALDEAGAIDGELVVI
ncbi:flagellar basal body P-ring protein FlgI [Rubrivivax gelatinosus]|uniref:flagellar basal body P-ring protein FlgI n=1 Tax=Rubrivivax gelatinosus TaxID=28068 RepID=UPI0003037E21|nr:flagellar basal body P-ring protein FlgI [Rubrivivax gelatinosus]MBG6081862.1 flagellar P-ring protein precursor FlgI [Rubrivivax gelatinosus]